MSGRASIGLGFIALSLGFLIPTASALVFEPQMGFQAPADFFRIDLIRQGYDSAIWRLGDAAEILFAVALLLVAAGLSLWPKASGAVLGRAAVAAATMSAGLFLVVGMIGIVGVETAEGIGAIDQSLADPGLASAMVVRSAFRAASVFATGVFLLAFIAASLAQRLVHPIIALLGLVPAAASFAFPWIMLPVPLAYVVWFGLAGANLLAARDA
ncbi:MAG: hypothetical protein PVI23_09350 [Maricaulaceae bacterium]|jgi:hypothetical protein